MFVPPETFRKLDALVRSDFQSAAYSCFWWLIAASVVVAVGVTLEGPEIVHDSARVMRRIIFRIEPDHRETPSWIVLLGLIGWLLVVIGVAGEGVADAFVFNADSRLESFNDALLTGAQLEIARTAERTADAEERAEDAVKQTTGFRAQIASANARAREAEAMVASANASAAEAQSMARSADLARVRLEERIAPRTLTVAQREYIGQKLSGFARQFIGDNIKLDWRTSEAEPTVFAIEVEDALKRAHIGVDRPGALVLGGPLNIGIAIKGPVRKYLFIKLLFALLWADFPRENITWEARPQYDELTVTIGTKTPEGLDTLPVPPTTETAPQQ